jgi:hypothetical protein
MSVRRDRDSLETEQPETHGRIQQWTEGGIMTRIVLVVMALILLAPVADGEDFGISPITNELSFYKNTDDDFNSLGRTLQIISINSFKAFTWFNLEFTGDFNWKMAEEFDGSGRKDYDYYLELSLVKPLTKYLSLNYQRVYGTFIGKPVNQFGLRLSL